MTLLPPLRPPAAAGEGADRPTRLSPEEISALRDRARREAGTFVDPKVVHAPRHFHNRDWAAAVVGRPDFDVYGHWPTMYLLYIAMQAEPEPPVTRAQLAERAEAEARVRSAEEMRVLNQQRAAGRRRAEVQAWADAVRGCLVKVVVRENRYGRVRGGARERLRHAVPVSEAVSGRRRRHLAGRTLCETPGRAKPLRLANGLADGPVTCQRCLAYAAQIRPGGAS
ncbi:hypothetical protein [Kitasatospora sp. NPDC088134]|uniref:hypothetical protein n=1 Tax=Kitasatospora sp. NPDC088134 TaxID=3364071 RepID=UPI00382C2569